nr:MULTISPECIES: hypothetical protein [unclassified Siphonobacter]
MNNDGFVNLGLGEGIQKLAGSPETLVFDLALVIGIARQLGTVSIIVGKSPDGSTNDARADVFEFPVFDILKAIIFREKFSRPFALDDFA